MYTRVGIVNLGLAKLGSARVSRLDPATSQLERHVASGYDHWKRSEIGKRRWTFARVANYKFPKLAENDKTFDGKPYKFELPSDMVRLTKTKTGRYERAGSFLYSGYSDLRDDYFRNVDESELDPLFAEVLACRVALECVEYVTQSNTKKSDIASEYAAAVRDASKANAFEIGPENISDEDDQYALLNARFTPYG